MRKSIRSFLIASLLFLSGNSFAQNTTVVQDFELWTGVQLQKSLLENKLSLGLTQEFRFDDNSTSINNYFTEFEAGYELFKDFRLDAGYRFIRNNKNSGYSNKGRFFMDANYKTKLDRLKIGYRLRYQNHTFIGDPDSDATNKYRLRLKFDYNIKNWKFDPYFSAEGFYAQTTNRINYIPTITEVEKVAGFQKLRLTVGTQYKFNKTISLGGFYRYEREFGSYPLNYNTPRNFFIAGLNLKFDL